MITCVHVEIYFKKQSHKVCYTVRCSCVCSWVYLTKAEMIEMQEMFNNNIQGEIILYKIRLFNAEKDFVGMYFAFV